MIRPGHLLCAAILPAGLALAGCAANSTPHPRARRVEPGDFVNTPQTTGSEHQRMNQVLHAAEQGEVGIDMGPKASPPSESASANAVAGHAAPRGDKSTPRVSESGGGGASGGAGRHAGGNAHAPAQAYMLDAMVGQVNGQAIYADDVLKPMSDQLALWGRKLSRTEFHQRARQAIHARLEQMVANALILGAAQRDLSDDDRRRLDFMVNRQREELLRRYGRGSVSLAEHNLRQQTGKTLAQTLKDYRRGFVVQRYLRKKLLPKINVSRRDVERYYRDHPDEFHQPPQRVLRLIRTDTQTAAARISDRLKEGTPFAKVAADKLNLNRPDQGGLMSPIVGDHAFGDPALNEAVNGLTRGKWAGPIHVGDAWLFVYLENYTPAKTTSLKQAQIDIKKKLTEEQYQRLTAAYRDQLFKQGSYNSLSQMTDDLVRIAMNRY